MRRLAILTASTVSLLILGISLPAGNAVAQQKSLKEQLVGTWKLVSSHNVRNDGSKIDVYGPNANGIVIYTSDGHFALVNTRSDLPKFASNSRDRGTPEEYKAVVQGSIAYFGTYTVNEADKVITAQIEGSTFPNAIGGPDQKRIITFLTADELKFTNPAATSRGGTLELVWKRAKQVRLWRPACYRLIPWPSRESQGKPCPVVVYV
jgi:Lipocalin-like domain